VSRTDRNWIGGDELFAFAYFENVRFHIDLYGDARGCASSLLRSSALRTRLIFHLIGGGLGAYVAARLNLFYRGDFKRFDVWHHELIAGAERFQLTRIELLKKMNVAVKFLRDCIRSIPVRQKF